jgi:hypothetical protein
MGPIGHFAIGLLCGTLIMLPFLRDRSLFDYERQRWVSIEWMPYIRSSHTPEGTKLFSTDNNTEDSVTNELNPITKSKFMLLAPIVALICGVLALLPDISHLWGVSSLDKSRVADVFFFHYTLDSFFVSNGFPVMEGLVIEASLIFSTAGLMLCLLAISQNNQYNRNNFENCVV